MRAVVDTNVWVSAILNPSGLPGAVLRALKDGRFTLVSCEHLLDEIEAVLARPRLSKRYRVTPADIQELTVLLSERAEIAAVAGTVRLCRDPDDDLLIEAARVGLVTRDDDLKSDRTHVNGRMSMAGYTIASTPTYDQAQA